MTATNPARAPRYPYCGRGADPDGRDPVGCRGRRVRRPPADEGEAEPYGACLAHLTDTDLDAYLTTLRPGSDLHHPYTTFDAALLRRLLEAVHDPATKQLRLGAVDFSGAVFEGEVRFNGAAFESEAWFSGTTFQGEAEFSDTVFHGSAGFSRAAFQGEAAFHAATFRSKAVFSAATFHRSARFTRAAFQGEANFYEAVFQEGALFRMATFQGYVAFTRANCQELAVFEAATFQGDAGFSGVTFQGNARYRKTTFERAAWFNEVTFAGTADFHNATLQGHAGFRGATFQDDADFSEATLHDDAMFGATAFQGDAVFVGATFEHAARIGPLACRGTVDFSAAVFGAAVIVEVAARGLECRRTRWASTAALRLRHTTVDLSDAVLEYPVNVTAHATPFRRKPGNTAVDESGIDPAAVRMLSLQGVDTAHLSLTDVDLTACRFAGTVHLDQLRLYGRCPLSPAPGGWHRRGLLRVRFTARQTLAEEHHWRAGRARATAGWTPDSDPLEPAALVPLYRELRKAFENGKNEPGAADFYYGEMEMRRHDPRTPAAERFLLHLYWALSGYGLRASRAIGWLLGAMAATVLLMMAVGLPDTPAKPHPPGAGVIGKQDPGLHAAFAERFTGARAQKAADVVVNSVVFRSSGQDLTTAGRYTEMASRFTEPVLLGLAALAIRGRVKR